MSLGRKHGTKFCALARILRCLLDFFHDKVAATAMRARPVKKHILSLANSVSLLRIPKKQTPLDITSAAFHLLESCGDYIMQAFCVLNVQPGAGCGI